MAAFKGSLQCALSCPPVPRQPPAPHSVDPFVVYMSQRGTREEAGFVQKAMR